MWGGGGEKKARIFIINNAVLDARTFTVPRYKIKFYIVFSTKFRCELLYYRAVYGFDSIKN